MAIVRTHPHSGTVGATVDPVAEGYTNGAGALPTYVATGVSGGTSLDFAGGAAGYLNDNITDEYSGFYLYLPALPAADVSVRRIIGTGTVSAIAVTPTGALTIWNGLSTLVGTSTTLLAIGQWYRIEYRAGATGQELRLFSPQDAETPVETLTGATNGTAVTQHNTGLAWAGKIGGEVYIDQVVIADDWPNLGGTEPVGEPGKFGDTLTYSMNRLAGTLVNGVPTLAATGAANVWAGTKDLALVGALNVKAGNVRPNWLALGGVLNQLAGTTGLAPTGAAQRILA